MRVNILQSSRSIGVGNGKFQPNRKVALYNKPNGLTRRSRRNDIASQLSDRIRFAGLGCVAFVNMYNFIHSRILV